MTLIFILTSLPFHSKPVRKSENEQPVFLSSHYSVVSHPTNFLKNYGASLGGNSPSFSVHSLTGPMLPFTFTSSYRVWTFEVCTDMRPKRRVIGWVKQMRDSRNFIQRFMKLCAIIDELHGKFLHPSHKTTVQPCMSGKAPTSVGAAYVLPGDWNQLRLEWESNISPECRLCSAKISWVEVSRFLKNGSCKPRFLPRNQFIYHLKHPMNRNCHSSWTGKAHP